MASQLRVAAVAGAALATYTATPRGISTVRAALQEPADWTSLSCPTIALGAGRDPAVAGADEAGVIVWVDASGDLVGVRLEAAAWPSAPPPALVAPGPGLHRPDLARAPEAAAFLAVWLDAAGGVAGRLLDADGAPSGPVLGVAPPPAEAAAVSWDGGRFVVVLSRPSGIEAVRLTSGGVPIDPAPIAVAGPGARGAWAGSRPGETLAAWITGELWLNYQVRAARIDPMGQVLDPGGVVIHEGPYLEEIQGRNALSNQILSIVWSEPRYELLWVQNMGNCWGDYIFEDLLIAGLTPGDPPVASPARFAIGHASQWGLATASLGDSFWTAWVGGVGRNTDAGVGARWTPADSGVTLLDPGGITLVTASDCYPVQALSLPAVANGGPRVLTALRLREDTYGSNCWVTYWIRDASGQHVGGGYNAFFSGGPCTAPVVASDGRCFLVAYSGADLGHEREFHWFGVDEAGTPLADGYASAGPAERVLAAASNGANYMVGWLQDLDSTSVALGRFAPDFTLLEPLTLLPAGASEATCLLLASNRDGYLAVWADSDTLRAARITGDGQLLDPAGFPVVSRRTPRGLDLDLAWDGTDYVLAWIDEEMGESVVRLRRITTEGDILDPEPVEGLRIAERIAGVSIAGRRDGLSLIAVTRSVGIGHGFLYRNPHAMPVELSSLSAVAAPGSVTLSWSTGWEVNVLGFHILRSETPEFAQATRVTAVLLPAGQDTYVYVDRDLPPGGYWYWLEEEGLTGEQSWYGPVAARVLVPGHVLRLQPNTPNPFSNSTEIVFSLARRESVSLAVYTVRGELTRMLIDGATLEPGAHSALWDGRDQRGRKGAAGVYLCRLTCGEEEVERKLHLIR